MISLPRAGVCILARWILILALQISPTSSILCCSNCSSHIQVFLAAIAVNNIHPYLTSFPVAYLGGIRPWPLASHTLFFTKNLQAQCMDVWCEALQCRHINFTTLFQSATEKHAIFIQKIRNFGDGAQPPPRPDLQREATRTPRRLRRLDPSAFGVQPLAPFPKSYICHCYFLTSLLFNSTAGRQIKLHGSLSESKRRTSCIGLLV